MGDDRGILCEWSAWIKVKAIDCFGDKARPRQHDSVVVSSIDVACSSRWWGV